MIQEVNGGLTPSISSKRYRLRLSLLNKLTEVLVLGQKGRKRSGEVGLRMIEEIEIEIN